MATSSSSKHKKTSGHSQPLVKNGLAFVWLDDSVEQDPNSKSTFLSIFEQVFLFKDAAACLELIESADNEDPCISILVSGKYGQMLVTDRIQPLNQIQNIYVYCFDIAKHNQWAKQCNKVRCVESDFSKILKRIQQDVQKLTKKSLPQSEEQPQDNDDDDDEEIINQEPERFTDDNNFYDHLALELLLQKSDDDDDDDVESGKNDFQKYCDTFKVQGGNQLKKLKSGGSIKEWFKNDLFITKFRSTDLTELWSCRWFLRIFYQQLTEEYDNLMRRETEFTVNYGTWLSTDEFDGIKQRLGQIIISTEFLLTYVNQEKALKSIENQQTEQKKHQVLFQITVQTDIQSTVPYGEIQTDEVLFWFGTRYRLMKIELMQSKTDQKNSYWLIGLDLCPKLKSKQSIQNLYEYYLKNLTDLNHPRHGLGRILMYKGLYSQAEKWLQLDSHWEELAEVAIRQNQLERAKEYLKNLPEESENANLLRAYVQILTSNDNISKARTMLLQIFSEGTDRIVRARANIALGFISLMSSQQIDQAFDYFKLGNESLSKNLPEIHPNTAKSWIGIGYVYFTQQKFDEAEKAFSKALNIQKQILTSHHPDLAKTQNGLAHCLATNKHTIKQALNELESALQILKQTFLKESKTHPEILSTKHDIEKVRKGKRLSPRSTLLDYI